MPRSMQAAATSKWARVGTQTLTASGRASSSMACVAVEARRGGRARGVGIGDGGEFDAGHLAVDAGVVGAHGAEADDGDSEWIASWAKSIGWQGNAGRHH